MKKIITTLLLIISFSLTLVSCNSNGNNEIPQELPGKLESTSNSPELLPDDKVVPQEYVKWLNEASRRCNEVNPFFLAAIIKVSSNFDAKKQEGKFSGPAMLSQSSMKTFGKDEDGNGFASTRDIGDSVWALARMSCLFVPNVEELSLAGAKSPANNMNPWSTLAAIVLNGGNPDKITKQTKYTDNVKKFEYWYSNISIDGETNPFKNKKWK